jgi:heterotetrameric sarcosine oxidase gamma subunit
VSVVRLLQFIVTAANVDAFAVYLKAFGLAVPANGMSLASGPQRFMNISPNHFWLLEEAGQANVDATDVSKFGLTIDLTGSRYMVRLHGAHAEAKLSRLAPIDFHVSAFKPGMVIDTVCGSMPVTIWREETGFCLAVPLSYQLAFEHELATV